MNKIIFITPGLAKGGAETQLVKLARFLSKKDHEILIISLKEIFDFTDDPRKEGIQILFLKNNWVVHFFSNTKVLFASIRKFKPDNVVAFMFIAIIIARILKIFLRFRLVSTIRASRIDNKWRAFFKLSSSLDDVIVYNSYTSKLYFEKANLVQKKGIVINNAISVPADLSVENSGERIFHWISIAHFRIDKDYVTLFKAIALLKEHRFKINIIGHLYDLEWPAQLISELKIESHVNLLGFQANTSDFLRNSDALILSSFSEGMPNAVLEAMAYSKPVIGSDIESLTELLSKSKSGVLFKTGDAKDLASKMLSIMNMPLDERLSMGFTGRKFIEKEYDEDSIFQNWLKILNPNNKHSYLS